MYGLSWSLNKANLEYFWLWVLGISDQYVHSKITNDYYDEEQPTIQSSFFEVNKTIRQTDMEQDQGEEESKGDK